ncbi:MAG: DUF4347 domain-containing protein [Magnetococcales bacterium]|nr:DUF4347 domain-containing protein [Magnetococcales bacterium]
MAATALEPRILLDAAAVVTGVEALADGPDSQQVVIEIQNSTDSDVLNQPDNQLEMAPTGRHDEVLFVDTRLVQDYEHLLSGVAEGVTAVLLNARGNGLEQIAQSLAGRENLSAIHIMSHGSEGNLWLGTEWVNLESMESAEHQREAWSAIGDALNQDGDILLYACGTASGDDGAAFVEEIAHLTGADVAASNDRTAAAQQGGNWDLEVVSGVVETTSILDTETQQSYDYALATITVTSNADSGTGSLRQAISDATSGDTITFNSSMTVTLSSGELAISKNLEIDGDIDDDLIADVTIDANYSSRVFNISSGTVKMDGLIVTHGLLYGDGSDGSALGDANQGGSSLGAGIYNAGTLSVVNSTITMNFASGGGGGAGSGTLASGGGGGGGYNGIGGGTGGAFAINGTYYTATAGSGGSGSDGGYPGTPAYTAYHGQGGSSTGGAEASGYSWIWGSGGKGGTAAVGSISIGGGGGGVSNRNQGTGGGAWGGHAVGGIHNTASGILNIASSTLSYNFGAGGGGGGGNASIGVGGHGIGAIYTLGTLNFNSSTVTLSNNVGDGGDSGASGLYNSLVTSTNDIQGTASDNTSLTITNISSTTTSTAPLIPTIFWSGMRPSAGSGDSGFGDSGSQNGDNADSDNTPIFSPSAWLTTNNGTPGDATSDSSVTTALDSNAGRLTSANVINNPGGGQTSASSRLMTSSGDSGIFNAPPPAALGGGLDGNLGFDGGFGIPGITIQAFRIEPGEDALDAHELAQLAEPDVVNSFQSQLQEPPEKDIIKAAPPMAFSAQLQQQVGQFNAMRARLMRAFS